MKRYLSALLLIVILVSLIPQGMLSEYKKVYSDSILDSLEKDLYVSNLQSEVKPFLDNPEVLTSLKKDLEIDHIRKPELSEAVKAYYPLCDINKEMLLAGVKAKKFDSLISEKYVWLFPIYDGQGSFINSFVISKVDSAEDYKNLGERLDKTTVDWIKLATGKLYISQINSGFRQEDMDILSNRGKIATLLRKSDVLSAQVIKIIDFGGDIFIYVKTNEEEYGFVFTPVYQLKQGKKYRMSEIAEAIAGQYSR